MTPGSVMSYQSTQFSDSPTAVSVDTRSERSLSGTLTNASASRPGTPDEDPTAAYVHLKMRISELTTHRKPTESADATFLRMLQERLEEVKRDYFFDEREAETTYRAERKKADQLALQARLRGENMKSPPKILRRSSPPSKYTAEEPAEQDVGGDVFDEVGDDEGPGGLLELLEEMPQIETTSEGTTIQIRDLPAPKNWSGRTPRTLLLEVVHKTDKYANISFRSISGASRAKRTAVRVIWQRGNVSEWSMDDVACHDSGQAEQYISTVALHRLTFPETPGFAVGGTASASAQTSFRLLPPVYRDLWNELEDKRRNDHDRINRNIWAKLRNILEPKLSGYKVHYPLYPFSRDIYLEHQTPVRRQRVATQATGTTSGDDNSLKIPHSADIAADFRARQESVAYQEMFVSERRSLRFEWYSQRFPETAQYSSNCCVSR